MKCSGRENEAKPNMHEHFKAGKTDMHLPQYSIEIHNYIGN